MLNWRTYFKKIKTRKRILFSFLLVALISGIIGFNSILNLDKLQKANSNLYNKITLAISHCTSIATHFQQIRVLVRDAYLAETPAEAQQVFNNLDELDKLFLTSIKKLEGTIIDTSDLKYCRAIELARLDYISYFQVYKKLLSENNRRGAIRLMRGDFFKANERLQKTIDITLKYNIEAGKSISEVNTDLLKSTTLSMIVLIFIGVVAAISLGLIIDTNNKKTSIRASREVFVKSYWRYLFQGDYQNAEKVLTEGLKYCGNDIELYVLRARCRYDMKKYKDALYDFNTAILLDKSKEFKDLYEAFYSRGAIKYMYGDTDNALTDFNTAQQMAGFDLKHYKEFCLN